MTNTYLSFRVPVEKQHCTLVSLHHLENLLPSVTISTIFFFSHLSLSKGSRQNLCGSDCFILGTDDSVIKTSDWVAGLLLPDTSILGSIKIGLVAEPLSGTVVSNGTYPLKPSGPCNHGALM